MGLIDLIYPKNCLECKREGKYICLDCLAKVRLAKPICPYCQRFSIDGLTHPKCASTSGLNGLTSIWEYEGVIRKAIIAFKYKYSSEVGKELLNVFLSYYQKSKPEFFGTPTIIPIPMFWYKQNFRGFNQTNLIGKGFAEALGLKFEPEILTKEKSTIPQAELKRKDRKDNLKDTFSLNPQGQISLKSNSVILFDDVYTTGATLKEAASFIKLAGAKNIWGLTIAV